MAVLGVMGVSQADTPVGFHPLIKVMRALGSGLGRISRPGCWRPDKKDRCMSHTMQGQDTLRPEDMEFTVVSEAQPDERMLQDLKFAWLGVKHVKSNAITVAKDLTLLGMGSGQPNRVKSTQIALEKVCCVFLLV